MSLSLASLGFTTSPHSLEYDWQRTVLYALGIGATAQELDYLYEGRSGGQRVFASFAVVPAYPVLTTLLAALGGDVTMMVHAGQRIRLESALPPAGVLDTVGRVRAMYDMKRMALVVLETQTTCAGSPLCSTEWSLLFRGEGGFGGEKRPKPEKVDPPAEAASTFETDYPTSAEQALLYRLSGDTNPLHADPEFARTAGFERPILHGLATFGVLCRAVTAELCGGDSAKMSELGATFTKPVMPGDTLRVRGYAPLESGAVPLSVTLSGTDTPVLGAAYARVR